MKIEVLGAGCPKCLKLESMVKETVARLGLDAEVSHVYNVDEIVERGGHDDPRPRRGRKTQAGG